MNDCILFVVFTVVLHVSAPESRTDFTLLLKILIFVVMARSFALQMFF